MGKPAMPLKSDVENHRELININDMLYMRQIYTKEVSLQKI